MNDVAPSSAPTPESELGALVDEWLDWSETASALGVRVHKVRTMLREHDLAAAVPSAGARQKAPARLTHDGQFAKGRPGLLTMFHDGGWSDRECIEWIYTYMDLPGRPIDALRENRGSEVKRRAQAEAL